MFRMFYGLIVIDGCMFLNTFQFWMLIGALFVTRYVVLVVVVRNVLFVGIVYRCDSLLPVLTMFYLLISVGCGLLNSVRFVMNSGVLLVIMYVVFVFVLIRLLFVGIGLSEVNICGVMIVYGCMFLIVF